MSPLASLGSFVPLLMRCSHTRWSQCDSPRIVRTLQAVSYLVPPLRRSSSSAVSTQDVDTKGDPETAAQVVTPASSSRTLARLLETFQFVLDVLGCTVDSPPIGRGYLMPGGDGWKAAVRVRMLHGVARRRARVQLTKEDAGDEEGVPVSQEDMCATYVLPHSTQCFLLTQCCAR